MQWLIDILAERVIATIGIPPVYIDRGDPAIDDFTFPDFTVDNAWHDLDLSAIVPEGAKAVQFHAEVRAPIIGDTFALRKNGNVNAANINLLVIQVGDVVIAQNLASALDTNRFIEYRVINPLTQVIILTVKGWWL